MGKSHEEFMIERFRADPAYAVTLLNSILDDGDDQGELRVFLRQMAAAFGIEPEAVENTSDIETLVATVRAMGLRLSVAPIPPKPRRRAKAAKPSTPKRAACVRRTATKTSTALV